MRMGRRRWWRWRGKREERGGVSMARGCLLDEMID